MGSSGNHGRVALTTTAIQIAAVRFGASTRASATTPPVHTRAETATLTALAAAGIDSPTVLTVTSETRSCHAAG